MSVESITIRIVFDGAPFAGKTTAAYSLGEALGEVAVTPDEVEGRTVWFDWVSYTGGRHEGKPIRVELVTVPGQSHLGDRRRHLLGWGDVVVFVADTSAAAFGESVEKFGELRRDLVELGGAPVVVLANKRDLVDAVDLVEVRERLGLEDDDSLIEGVATSGGGVRQAFIFAVRAALAVRSDRDEVSSSDELLAHMQAMLTAAALPEQEPAPATSPLPEPEPEPAQTEPRAQLIEPPPAPSEPERALHDVCLSSTAVTEGASATVTAREWQLLAKIANGMTTIAMDEDSLHAELAEVLLDRGLIRGRQVGTKMVADADASEVHCWRLEDEADPSPLPTRPPQTPVRAPAPMTNGTHTATRVPVVPLAVVEPGSDSVATVAGEPAAANAVATVVPHPEPEFAPGNAGEVDVPPAAAPVPVTPSGTAPAVSAPVSASAEAEKRNAMGARNQRYRALRELRRSLRS